MIKKAIENASFLLRKDDESVNVQLGLLHEYEQKRDSVSSMGVLTTLGTMFAATLENSFNSPRNSC